MKKIFALILCAMLVFVTPLVASAEGEAVTEENPTGGEISPSEVEELATEWDHLKNLFSENAKDWILSHAEEISVVVTLVFTAFYNMRKHKLLNKSMGTLNNNAITVAKESAGFMGNALSEMQTASGAVVQYDARITELLDAFKQTAEDKLRLEAELVEMKSFLKTATDANIEFANELADLIALANIPNYKKEELGSRHVAYINAIIEAEKKAEAAALLPTNTEEVKADVGEEKEI